MERSTVSVKELCKNVMLQVVQLVQQLHVILAVSENSTCSGVMGARGGEGGLVRWCADYLSIKIYRLKIVNNTVGLGRYLKTNATALTICQSQAVKRRASTCLGVLLLMSEL